MGDNKELGGPGRKGGVPACLGSAVGSGTSSCWGGEKPPLGDDETAGDRKETSLDQEPSPLRLVPPAGGIEQGAG